MAKPDTWMPLFIGDYLADTLHLNAEQHGAYLLLLMAAWMRGGPLPDDDEQLARMARCTEKQWARIRPSIATFFDVGDGTWRQKRVAAELTRATANASKAEDKARRAAEARWGKKNGHDAPSSAPSNAQSIAPSSAPSIATSMPGALLEDCPPPPPSPTSGAKAPSAKTARGAKRSLPVDFGISDRVRKWAAANGHRNLERHLEHFVGYARANGKTYADWDDALMNAIRSNWAKLPMTEVQPNPASGLPEWARNAV